MYYCFGDKDKISLKGINQIQNELTKKNYLEALNGDSSQTFTNTGFRNTYVLTKSGMKIFNDERLREGFKTVPTTL